MGTVVPFRSSSESRERIILLVAVVATRIELSCNLQRALRRSLWLRSRRRDDDPRSDQVGSRRSVSKWRIWLSLQITFEDGET